MTAVKRAVNEKKGKAERGDPLGACSFTFWFSK